MSLYHHSDPFFNDFEDEFFNHPLIPAFPFYQPAFYNNRRHNSKSSLEKNSLIDFSPKINLSEDENNYYIHADLPGMKKDQVKMEISDDRTFTISGERESFKDSDDKEKNKEGEEAKEGEKKKEGQDNKNKKNKKFHMMECSYGKFERSFSIPEDADLNNIQAKMENGVLEVSFKKMEPPKTQQRIIQIQ